MQAGILEVSGHPAGQQAAILWALSCGVPPTHWWPQSYFTPFCDVVLRFESLKRDFDGLMAKIGCPLRIPPARENRGNRLVPLLADDVVASVRRMYADDYSLVKRLAGLGLDDLLANATRLT